MEDRLLALPWISEGCDYEQGMVCGIVTSVRAIIAAGRSFYETYEQSSQSSVEASSSEEGEEEGPASPVGRKKHHETRKKKEQLSGNALRLSSLVRDVNLYEVLEVSESSSFDEIKKFYRKLVLEKHPDKLQNSGLSKEAEEKGRVDFLKIQEAFEVLSEPRSRRMYDSSLPFDDTIPSEKEVSIESDFYTVFEAAFKRNERWSVSRPVPKLGSMESSKDQVDKFYDFWFNRFESWRDFSHHDEHDLKQAESRDEKRWMEVQNARIRKKRLAEENSRIRKLVDLAEKLDPRLRRWRVAEADAIAEEKKRKQLEKEQQLQLEEYKLKQKQRLVTEKLLLEELEKEKVKAEKSEIKRIRAEIRNVLSLNNSDVDPGILSRFNDALIALLSDVSKAQNILSRAKDAVALVRNDDFIQDVIQKKIDPHISGATTPIQEEVDALSCTPLQSGMTSTTTTPNQEADVIVTTTTPIQEVVDHEEGVEVEGGQEKCAWTADELQLLTRGMQKYPVGTNRRWEVIQSLIGSSKTVSEIIDMSKIVASKKVIEPVSHIISKKKVEPVAPPDVDYERQAKSATSSEEWSPLQQKQLEDAMRKYPATMTPSERWSAIANDVEGKTKPQCVARFKYIRELISKKK